MDKYIKSEDFIKKIEAIRVKKNEAIISIEKMYIAETDKLIEANLSLQRGQVYRHREGGTMDYRGYFKGIIDNKVHLEICLADGTLTGKHFYCYWSRCIKFLEKVELR